MTKSYAQLVKQIAALQEEADSARRKEVEGVIERIREAIEVYNLTAADLGFRSPGRPKGGASSVSTSKPSAPAKRRGRKAGKGAGMVKYANGSGGTWGGLGKRPQWLRDALASGKSLEDFAVK